MLSFFNYTWDIILSNWSVVTTAKSDKEVIDIFIDHYIKAGVSEIFIYLDDSADSFIKDAYFNNTKVKIYVCDKVFWSIDYKFNCFKFVGRPDGVEDRQCHNIVHALSKTTAKWIASVDIDELIYCEKNISSVLNSVPNNIYSLRLKPFEATYLNAPPQTYQEAFSTRYFKHLTKRNDVFFWNDILPKNVMHNTGFIGHISGKYFIRSDEPLKLPSIHYPQPLDTTLITNFRVDDLKLLHYEALTVDYFIKKSLNRINKSFNVKYLDRLSIARLELFKKIFDSNGLDGLKDSYNKIHVLDSSTIKKAISIHVVDEIDTNNINNSFISVIMSVHYSFLTFNINTNECQLTDINQIENLPNNLKIVEIHYDIDQGLCYLFTKINNKIVYLYLDRHGRLISYPLQKAMIFKCQSHDTISPQISILNSNNQYFTGMPNGEFKIGAKEAKAWEIFCINKRLCCTNI